MNNVKIERLTKHHLKELDFYSEQVEDYLEKYGNDKSDYLIHRLRLKEYHSGALSVLNSL